MLMRTPHRWVRPKRQLPPDFMVPCQPTPADEVPEGDGWIYELKHDGFRILAFKDGEKVRLWSRDGRDWSASSFRSPRPCAPCPIVLAKAPALVLGLRLLLATDGQDAFVDQYLDILLVHPGQFRGHTDFVMRRIHLDARQRPAGPADARPSSRGIEPLQAADGGSHGNSRERNGVAMIMMLTAHIAKGARKLGCFATCLTRAATAAAVILSP